VTDGAKRSNLPGHATKKPEISLLKLISGFSAFGRAVKTGLYFRYFRLLLGWRRSLFVARVGDLLIRHFANGALVLTIRPACTRRVRNPRTSGPITQPILNSFGHVNPETPRASRRPRRALRSVVVRSSANDATLPERATASPVNDGRCLRCGFWEGASCVRTAGGHWRTSHVLIRSGRHDPNGPSAADGIFLTSDDLRYRLGHVSADVPHPDSPDRDCAIPSGATLPSGVGRPSLDPAHGIPVLLKRARYASFIK
jgi:hypothetical protein